MAGKEARQAGHVPGRRLGGTMHALAVRTGAPALRLVSWPSVGVVHGETARRRYHSRSLVHSEDA
jgi:hypothetical protein